MGNLKINFGNDKNPKSLSEKICNFSPFKGKKYLLKKYAIKETATKTKKE
jgi:hypothetical protein